MASCHVILMTASHFIDLPIISAQKDLSLQNAAAGLSSAEAAERLAAEGFNELHRAQSRTLGKIAYDVVSEPMFGLLIAAGLVYLALGDLAEALLLLAFASISVTIAIVQEARSERVLEALRDLTSPRALVIRDGERQRIPGREVVRGDLLVLGEGDRVAADAVLVSASDLSIDESVLTGESVPVRKRAADSSGVMTKPGGDDLPCVFSGTLVARGQGIAKVRATGPQSEIGKIGEALGTIEAAPPRLKQETGHLVRLVAGFGLAACVLVVLLYGLSRGSWLEAFLAGIALGMSMLPEEFPLVLAVFLVMGAWRISRARVLTRRATAIETLGEASVLCTDKTGTLTLNRMSIVELVADGEVLHIDPGTRRDWPEKFRRIVDRGRLACATDPFDPMERAFHALAAQVPDASDAVVDGGPLETWGLRPDLLAVTQAWKRRETGAYIVAAKGAPEAIGKLCRLEPTALEALRHDAERMARRGLRVLAVAEAAFTGEDWPTTPSEFAFAFLGLVGLADPLRPSVKDAVRECQAAGIRVVMITGDYPATAAAIAREAGLPSDAVVTGDEIEATLDRALPRMVARADVFARILPGQKLRIVRALKADGAVIAMTGDGVNDAPALKAADIGIAMGGRGTDVAREAASIVLLDDDFGSIVKTIRLGRRIYDNLRKAMGYILAVHVPIAGLALLPLLSGLPLILMPIHIAFLEMVIDPVCSVVFEAEKEEKGVMERPPRAAASRLFAPSLVLWSLVQGVLALGTVAAIYLTATVHGMPEAEVRALTFVTLVLADFVLILVNRSFGGPFSGMVRWDNQALWWVTLVTVSLLGLALTFEPVRDLFRFGRLHVDDLAVAVAATVALAGLLEFLKGFWRARLAGDIATMGDRVEADDIAVLAHVEPEAACARLGSDVEGLTQDEVVARLSKFGPNRISREQRATILQEIWARARNPLNALLLTLATISYFLGDVRAAVVIAAMVVLAITTAFIQEHRSNDAAAKLRAMVHTTASVRRRPRQSEEEPFSEIPMEQLVPGDIVRLSAGDMIPADLRLLDAKDLFINQSALTGEAMPVEKYAHAADHGCKDPFDLPNLCFMGANVVSGYATGVVLRTGRHTFFGKLADKVAQRHVPTAFDEGIGKFTWLMIRFIMIMVPAVFLINGLTKHDWLEALLFAVAVAVGLTPEMLPMIVTVNLAKGAIAMSRNKVIVKRLNSIQNLGAMDVLCTDKTGTLTQDRIILKRHLDIRGEDSEQVLQYAYLNSHFQSGLRNLLDNAILAHADLHQALGIDTGYSMVDEMPFDFLRRRLSVVVARADGKHILICKGAVEEIFAVCTRYTIDGEIGDLDASHFETAKEETIALNSDGFRVVAVAYKEMDSSRTDYTVADEADLVLLGYIAFLDPPKDSAVAAIAALAGRGIQVKILTGDNEVITRKICHEVKLDAGEILLGSQVETASDADLAEIAERTNVFAKLNPAQKERVVRALHSNGHVVGFLGDGINDSPALKVADVSISVDTAVDIAKESADIILLEKSLLVLDDGVVEGRRIFANITKYIKMGASSNFGNMFSVLGASLFLPFLPMAPIQVLTNNLLYDISQAAIPTDNVDAEFLDSPRRWDISNIFKFMVFIGPISSIFDYATYGMMIFVFGAWTNPSLFQTGWFVESLLTQTLIIHIIRTAKVPFFESRASPALITTSIIICCVAIMLPFTWAGSQLGFTPLPWLYFPLVLGMLLTYAILTHLVKVWFVRRWGP
jgi:Mg2+-importing ATPase